MLCHTLKGNRLSFYKNLNGINVLDDHRIHRLKLKVEDSSGNFAEAGCFIKNARVSNDSITNKDGLLCLYGNSVQLHSKNYSVKTAPFSFYEDIRITHGERTDSKFNATLISPLITIGTNAIPVHDPITITIKPFQGKNMRSANLVAVQIDSSGTMNYIPSRIEKGWMTFKSRNLGDFAIVSDSTPPASKTPFWEPDDYSGKPKLVIAVNDAISGISSIKCLINSVWVPAVYSNRRSQINIYPEDLPDQENPFQLQIELEDNAGNKGKYDFLVPFQ